MNISKINSFNTFTSKNKSSFRDDELFNDKKDIVKTGYATYDGYDTTINDLVEEAIDYYYPNISDNRIEERQQINNAIKTYSLSNNPITPNKKNDDIVDLSILKGTMGDRFSGTLYSHLMTKLDNFSIDQISTVSAASKLTKADSREYIDYNLLNAGFVFLKKYPKANLDDIFDLMNSVVVRDDNNNEIVSLNALDFLMQNKSNIKKCIKAVETGMNCDDNGVFINFNTYEAEKSLLQNK